MRAVLITVLDLVGMLLLVAAGAVWAAELNVTEWVRGFAVAGAGLILVSWIADGTPTPKWKGRR